MDTWFVGRQPIGFYKETTSKEQAGLKVWNCSKLGRHMKI